MSNHRLEQLEKKLERKAKRREKKRRPTMKVSGASVRKLQRLLLDKAKVDKSR